MATRKVFSDGDKELSYRIGSNKILHLEILMPDNTIAGISLDKDDALQFIQELNKYRKFLSDK